MKTLHEAYAPRCTCPMCRDTLLWRIVDGMWSVMVRLTRLVGSVLLFAFVVGMFGLLGAGWLR